MDAFLRHCPNLQLQNQRYCHRLQAATPIFYHISQTILKNVTAQEYAGRCHAQVTTERDRTPRSCKLRFLFPTWRSTKETACSTVTARTPKQASGRRRTLDCWGMKIKQRLQYFISTVAFAPPPPKGPLPLFAAPPQCSLLSVELIALRYPAQSCKDLRFASKPPPVPPKRLPWSPELFAGDPENMKAWPLLRYFTQENRTPRPAGAPPNKLPPEEEPR